MTGGRFLASTALCLVLTPELVPTARAQDVKLEEITVTARKVEENLMVVPIAISALSTDALNARGLKTQIDLSSFTPGFFQQDTTSATTGRSDRSQQTLVFRGLNVAGNSGLNAGGSVFIDGAPVTSLTAAGFADVSRVEVLRGPQSVYFGRSTFGGAVNYVTREPNLENFQGKVIAEVGSYGSTDDTISLEGPIVADKLAIRVTGYHTIRGGQWTNAANPNEKLGEQGTNSISTSILAKPSDNLKIKAYFDYYEDKDGAPAEAALNPDQSNCTTVSGAYFCGKLPKLAPQFISAYDVISPSYLLPQLFQNVNHFPVGFNPMDNEAFGLRRWAYQSDVIVNYETPSGYNFNSITAYHQSRFQAVDDLDFRDSESSPNALYGIVPGVAPFINWTSLVQQKNHDFSEEARITSPQSSRFRWVAGANYFSAFINNWGYTTANFGPLDFGVGQPNFVHTTGLFGGLYYDLMDNLTLSGEARYQWDKIKAVYGTNILQNTFKAFTPRVTLDYKLNPDSSLYALYSKGERPGGFNSTLLALNPNQLSQVQAQSGGGLEYQQEKLQNFEVGIKDRFLDNRASIRAAAYYGVLTSEQTASQVSVDIGLPDFNIYSVTLNIGKTDIYGFEFEGDLQATDHLLLSGTFDWAGSKIKQYNCLDCTTYHSGSANVIGNRLDDVPEFTGSLSAEYTDHLAGDYNWFTRVDYIYTGTIYVDLNNNAQTGAANHVNLHLGIRNKTLSLEGYVNNLTNNQVYTGAYYGVNTVSLTNTQFRIGLPMKRAFGLRATYNF